MSEPMEPLATECPAPCVTVTVKDLTTGDIDGDGVFDVMMRSVRQHLIREHDSGRITGDAFAKAYIMAMQAAMDNASQFTLMKDRVGYELENLWKQRELTEEELARIRAQTALIIEQTEVLKQNQDLGLLR